jgi:hypothetical protein
MNIQIPEGAFPVHLLEPKADAAGRTGVYLSLKNAVSAFIVAYIDQGNAATIALTPLQASAVAGTGSKALTAVTRVWANLDCAASNAFTKPAEAANYTTDAGVKKKIVIFEIDPNKCMDVSNGFDCISMSTGASNAANITSATLFVVPRHKGATAQSVIAD